MRRLCAVRASLRPSWDLGAGLVQPGLVGENFPVRLKVKSSAVVPREGRQRADPLVEAVPTHLREVTSKALELDVVAGVTQPVEEGDEARSEVIGTRLLDGK